MDYNQIVRRLFGEHLPVLVGGLSILLFAFLIAAVVKGDLRDLWVVIGLIGLLILILSNQRGATVFLATMVLGTLVAREEFLLEVAAMFRGTTLREIRETRTFESRSDTTVAQLKLEKDLQALELKRKELQEQLTTQTVENPKEVAKELQSLQNTLEISKDAVRLSVAAEKALHLAATKGRLTAKEFRDEMKKNGISEESGFEDVISQLIKPGYADSKMPENLESGAEYLFLTEKGLELARKFGLNPVKPNTGP